MNQIKYFYYYYNNYVFGRFLASDLRFLSSGHRERAPAGRNFRFARICWRFVFVCFRSRNILLLVKVGTQVITEIPQQV